MLSFDGYVRNLTQTDEANSKSNVVRSNGNSNLTSSTSMETHTKDRSQLKEKSSRLDLDALTKCGISFMPAAAHERR